MTDLFPQPHPVVRACSSFGHRCRLLASAAAVALAVGLLAVGVFGFLAVDAAAAGPAQDPSTDTSAVGGATAQPVTTTTAPETGAGSRRVADENRKIWIVVAGLVAVAIGLSVLTARYWHQTRPVRAPTTATTGDTDDDTAVHAAANDATATFAEPAAPARAPALAEGPAGPQTDGDGDGDGEVQGRHSRRTVAGADHAAADDEWEPRGTGEHERVVIATAERVPRPDRSQRAAAYEAAGRSS